MNRRWAALYETACSCEASRGGAWEAKRVAWFLSRAATWPRRHGHFELAHWMVPGLGVAVVHHIIASFVPAQSPLVLATGQTSKCGAGLGCPSCLPSMHGAPSLAWRWPAPPAQCVGSKSRLSATGVLRPAAANGAPFCALNSRLGPPAELSLGMSPAAGRSSSLTPASWLPHLCSSACSSAVSSIRAARTGPHLSALDLQSVLTLTPAPALVTATKTSRLV
ncbi:hypothetical protein GGTG_06926 [Gaeumannomyces tritici R3-111a-1]|uniref:Uncharacterized protein n=1 Tax=Gaeumannomyces tritici (strain R3-111a-1) TaxID=644352 RepID=J3P079_GAET3|nr:hypothetical protein GGTG_06926 [Gaeumannomyces tritici R3-111a-1]EJT77012.1 hypothetical protein GGTG_06926 [Gaeumannomyces tritici R3-111a-1]